jgi:protein TonB
MFPCLLFISMLFLSCLPAQAQNIKLDSIYQYNGVDENPIFTYKYKNSKDRPDLAFGYYFMNNLRYPQEAKRFGIEGIVAVRFIIEKDGSVSNVTLIKSMRSTSNYPDDIDKKCNEEALRLIREMPKWEAGKQNGKPVRVQMNYAVRFRLDD